MQVRLIWPILAFLLFCTSCKSNDNKDDIEKLLEIKLPNCYTEVENPEMIDESALEIEELLFSEDCFRCFLNEISEQTPSAYCGTAPTAQLTMVFCTRDESARMTINIETRILHFEKFK